MRGRSERGRGRKKPFHVFKVNAFIFTISLLLVSFLSFLYLFQGSVSLLRYFILELILINAVTSHKTRSLPFSFSLCSNLFPICCQSPILVLIVRLIFPVSSYSTYTPLELQLIDSHILLMQPTLSCSRSIYSQVI